MEKQKAKIDDRMGVSKGRRDVVSCKIRVIAVKMALPSDIICII